MKYEWDLNADGSYEFTGAAASVPWSALSGLPQPGVAIPVRLRVTDTFGVTDTDETELRIYVNEPVAAFTATPNPCACAQSVSFDAAGLVARPAGPADRELRMGLRLPDGLFTSDTTGLTVTHAYPTFGSRTVALRVTDNNVPPKTDTETVVVDVNQGNQAPVAEADGPYWIDVGQNLHLDGTGSSDPNAGCGDSLVSYEWDLNADGSYEYTVPTVPWSALQNLPQPGVAIPVRLRVTDNFGVTGTDRTEWALRQ